MRVARWGNSLAVRLPAAVVHELELAEGSEIELRPISKRTLEVVPDRKRQEAIQRLRALRVRLPKDYKFDREEANAR